MEFEIVTDIYTDGSVYPNPGTGGWAAVIIHDGGEINRISGATRATTNNAMELTAAIEAIDTLARDKSATVYTDSMYLINGATKWMSGWVHMNFTKANGSPLPNEILWRALFDLISTRTVEWVWIKSHSGDTWNEEADRLANAARKSLIVEMQTDAAPVCPAIAGLDTYPDLLMFNLRAIADYRTGILTTEAAAFFESIEGADIPVAIIANQNGVGLRHWMESGGFGEPEMYQSVDDAVAELTAVVEQIATLDSKLVQTYTNYIHKSKKSGRMSPVPEEGLDAPEWAHACRLPRCGLLLIAIEEAVARPKFSLYVSSSKDSLETARVAGCNFVHASRFFARDGLASVTLPDDDSDDELGGSLDWI